MCVPGECCYLVSPEEFAIAYEDNGVVDSDIVFTEEEEVLVSAIVSIDD